VGNGSYTVRWWWAVVAAAEAVVVMVVATNVAGWTEQ
jgi:hypothetical protein